MGEKKRRRRDYLNDFHQNLTGEYQYTGAHYTFAGQGSRRTFLTQLWLLCGGTLLAAVIAGCVPAAGMDNSFYVILPYGGGLVAAISLCWGLGRLTAGGDPLRAYVYEQTVEKLPGRAVVTAAFGGMTLLGEGIHLILFGFSGKFWSSALFLALETVIFAASLTARRLLLRQKWTK